MSKTIAQTLRDAINAVDDEELPYAMSAAFGFFVTNALEQTSLMELLEIKKILDECLVAGDRRGKAHVFMGCKDVLEFDFDEAVKECAKSEQAARENLINFCAGIVGATALRIMLSYERKYERDEEMQAGWALVNAKYGRGDSLKLD